MQGIAKIMQYKKWLVVVLVLLVGVAFGVNQYLKNSQPVVTGKTVKVAKGEVVSLVSATGTITPVNLVNVSAKITGLIEEVKVAENDQVTVGQVLMTLDDNHVATLVAQAKARLENANVNYQRMQKLARMGAIPVQQLDSARMDYDVALAAYDDAKSQLSDTIIRAPISGTVIGKPIPAGQTVSPGISTPMILLTVADMSKMQIEAQIDESDIGKIVDGQKATFTVDAYPDKTFRGIVSNISQRANIQQNVVYYTVTIDVEPEDSNLLKPTMTARVSIIVGDHQDVLWIPLTALRENKGQKYVQILREGKPQNVNVVVGLMSEDKAEIISGLTPEDELLLTQSKNTNPAAANSMKGIMGR